MYVYWHYEQKYCVYFGYFIHLKFVYDNAIMRIVEKEAFIMAIKYKTNILELLKNAGYTTYKLRKEKILGESTLQKMRTDTLLSWAELNTVCSLLGCQPGDLVEFIRE